MPVYDFHCPDHGVFTGLVSYTNSLSGLECPCCGIASPVLPALPQISTLSSALRSAENRAEATSCNPKVVKRAHLPECGCNLCKKAAPPTSRRWMLGQC